MTTMDDRADATGQPLATVTICTRNRAASLARTLASITEAAGAVSEDWELLVVDNGSTDNTAEVVDGFAGSLPIRRIHHPVPGLSNARNAGMAAARGRFIIWTDDDLTVDRDWLAAYLAAFRAWPDCAIFGGRAIPRYTEPVPAWFIACEDHLASLLAIRDAPGWDEITPERVPYGLNYAVRTDVQRAHPYDPELGVAPGRRLGGEETSMIREALGAGARGRWVWGATVHHLIPPERQTAAYIFHYYRAHGFRFPDLPVEDATPLRLSQAAGIAGRLGRKATMAALRRLRGEPAWVRSFISFARTVGTIDRLRGGRV